jgi:hypothetical protein
MEEQRRHEDLITCVICLDRVRGMVFQPCMHLCCCPLCAAAASSCPMCRRSIDSRLKIFLS